MTELLLRAQALNITLKQQDITDLLENPNIYIKINYEQQKLNDLNFSMYILLDDHTPGLTQEALRIFGDQILIFNIKIYQEQQKLNITVNLMNPPPHIHHGMSAYQSCSKQICNWQGYKIIPDQDFEQTTIIGASLAKAEIYFKYANLYYLYDTKDIREYNYLMKNTNLVDTYLKRILPYWAYQQASPSALLQQKNFLSICNFDYENPFVQKIYELHLNKIIQCKCLVLIYMKQQKFMGQLNIYLTNEILAMMSLSLDMKPYQHQ